MYTLQKKSVLISVVFLLIAFIANATFGHAIEIDQDLQSIETDKNFDGSWEGVIQTPDRTVYITLHLEYHKEDSSWSGSADILGRSLPFQEIDQSGESINAVVISGSDGFSLLVAPDGDQLTGTVSDQNEQYPIELESIPSYAEPADRIEAWQQDLTALTDRFLKYDYSFTPAEKDLFVEKIEALDDQISELNDSEIITRIASAVTISDNAHTRLYLLRNRTELRRLPVRLWWFSDGLYVVHTKASNRNLLGCRVDAIEGIPVRHVRDRVSAAFTGNPSWTDYKSVYYMTSSDILHGFGIAPNPEDITFSFSRCNNNRFNSSLSPLPLLRSADPVEAWWDLSPNHSNGNWIHVLADSKGSVPLYLRHPNLHYWFEYMDEENILYFQYNRASEMNNEDIASFGERLLKELDTKEVQKLVVDLRFNTGGSLGQAEYLMDELQKRAEDISRFIITGRATFSAGISHVATWKQDGNVTLVGEAVGDELDYWSEGGNIILPNSDLTVHFANAYHSYSEEPCPKDVPCFLDLNSPDLRPDIPVSTSCEEYINGIDVALDTVKSMCKR